MIDVWGLLALIFYLGGYTFKYEQFYDEYGQRPHFNELRKFKPKNKAARRNIRAVQIGAAFFLCLYLVFIPFSGSTEEQMADTELMKTFLKSIGLVILYINFIGRYAVYKEAGFKPPEIANSYYPIYDIFKKTGWLVSGKDWVVRAINISTAFGLILFLYMIYLSWGDR